MTENLIILNKAALLASSAILGGAMTYFYYKRHARRPLFKTIMSSEQRQIPVAPVFKDVSTRPSDKMMSLGDLRQYIYQVAQEYDASIEPYNEKRKTY